ncbi:hypothetical protein [Actinomyces sp. ZJ308]|uniref:hypothetical protein n=1 Tax=Actinomyces sp. ZJ308 TaxID=2708342 RepID=UPI001420324D|nr:hypothetical protein [Actinomyces sp. ZJ308]
MSTDSHPDNIHPSGDETGPEAPSAGDGGVGGDQEGWQAPDAGAFTGTSPYPYSPQGSPQGSPYPGYGGYQTPPVGQPGPPPGGQPGYGAYDGGQRPGNPADAGYGPGYAPYPGAPGDPGASGYPGYGGYTSVLAPKPSIIPLRPLSIGEILGGAFESLRANPKAMFVPSLVVMTIIGLLSAIVSAVFYYQLGAPSTYSSSGGLSEAELQRQGAWLAGTYAQSIINNVLIMFASSILTGLLIVTVSRTILGRKASPSDMWQRTRPRVWALIGQTLIVQITLGVVTAVFVVIGVGIGSVTLGNLIGNGSDDNPVGTVLLTILILLALGVVCLLAVLALYCKLSLAPAALILENIGVFEGISRSWTLTRGYFWRVMGIRVLSFIIIFITSAIATTPVSILAGALAIAAPNAEIITMAASVLLGNIIGAATLPFDSSVSALIYTDLRMRSEGLDVELRRAAGV